MFYISNGEIPTVLNSTTTMTLCQTYHHHNTTAPPLLSDVRLAADTMMRFNVLTR